MRPNDNDEILRYFKDELTYLRKMGAAFAEKYPKVATRLELGGAECPDPHVERLIESFAFLTARLQRNLDGEFPQITTALLGILYPQLVNPIPSMTVARFDVDPDQGKLTTGYTIPKHTPLFAQTGHDLVCWFRSCYPVTLWPLEVVYAGIENPAQFDFLDAATRVAAVIRLKIECRGASFHELDLKRLRFYLNAERMLATTLYELLFCRVYRVAVLPEDRSQPVYLPQDSIKQVGFGLDEDVLPYSPYSHPAYRLLQEYFTFPEKFLFFDVDHLDVRASNKTLDLLILLDHRPREHLFINKSTFVLGCAPAINLFRKTTEPIRLDHRQLEYRLLPDMRRERTTEIHTILKVSASSDSEERTQTIEPFYSFNHQLNGRDQKAFWSARRVPTGRKDLPGTDVLISFLDLDFKPAQPPVQTVFAHALCTNRALAEQLPAGARLQLEMGAPVSGVCCLTKPSSPLSPPLGGATLWRLISHLSLNYLSLSEGKESLQALREILSLYNFSDRVSAQQEIVGIRQLSCRRVVRHTGKEAWRGFCRGTEVTVTFDEDLYPGSGAFLLGAALNHFFALYAAVNSFTQLVIKSEQREGIWKKWPPMAGEKIVL